MKPTRNKKKYLQHFRNTLRKGEFPIGTLTYYGPDDQKITKIIAAILLDNSTDPILKKWVADGVAQDPDIAFEIGQFFQDKQVHNIVMTEGIIGCPHEESVDFPVGENCPFCPFWSDKKNQE